MSHSLRISIFLLRLALGISFFYLGWSMLFAPSLVASLHERSLGGLYTWIGGGAGSAGSFSPLASIPWTIFAWIALAIGALLIIGFLTRIASFVAIIWLLVTLLPAINFTAFNPVQLVNDEVVVLFALLVLIFGKAGHYLGIDGGLSRRKRKMRE